MRTLRIASMAAVVAVLAAGVALFTVGPVDFTARPGRTPSLLPSRLAGPALTTVAATTDPGGPSALIANYPELPVVGDLRGTQSVVVGPGNSYRTVPGDSLLDPHGAHVMLPGTDGSLTRLGLTDKASRRYDVFTEVDGYTRALAFAPDGNTVLYGTSPDRDSEFVVSVHRLDLRTGKTEDLRTPARMAAYSPDGTKIAVANDDGVFILEPATGKRTAAPEKGRLAGDDAWSPDGRLLAYQEAGELEVVLVPVDGSKATTVAAAGTFLGWRDATTMLVYDYGGRIRTAGIDGDTQQVMSMPVRTGISDVAGALVPTLHFAETAAPDRGPMLIRFRWPLLAVAFALAIAAAIVIANRRRRVAV